MSVLRDRAQCLAQYRPVVQLAQEAKRHVANASDTSAPLYERWFPHMIAEDLEHEIRRRIRNTRL